MFNDRVNTTHLLQSQVLTRFQNPFSSARQLNADVSPNFFVLYTLENKKAQDRWVKEEEKLLVQLLTEKHNQLESRE